MKRYHYQIFLGGAGGRGYSMEDIMEHLPSTDAVKALIVGWTEEKDVYEKLREYTKPYGIELWLWFPVFSEHSTQASFPPQCSIETKRAFGAAVFDGDETFDFCCPSDPALPGKLMHIYDRFYCDLGFDGIFLDRIRYPSLTMGIPALFGCMCPQCLSWFRERGLSEGEIMDSYYRLKQRIEDSLCKNPLGLLSYDDGTYCFDDPVLNRLIELRQCRITETVSQVVEVFRRKKLKIGMDLFAPFLAPFVGQDYRKLGQMADLVKPMLYRLTDTPAGMGYEVEAIWRAVACGNEETDRERKEFLQSFYGIAKDTTRKELFENELRIVHGFEKEAWHKGKIIPGIELHTVAEKEAISCDELEETIQMLEEEGFTERVACWDLMSTDKKHRDVFVNGMGV